MVPEHTNLRGKGGRTILGAAIRAAPDEISDELLTITHRQRRDDGRVTTLNGASPFQIFCPYASKMVVTACGDSAAKYLAENVHHLVMWVAKKAQASARMEWKAGSISATPTNRLREYEIRWLALKNIASVKSFGQTSRTAMANQLGRWNQQGTHKHIPTRLIEHKLRSGILARADSLGIDLLEEEVALEVLDRGLPIKKHGAHMNAYPILDRVRWRANVDFTGPWFVGPCSSKGWGRIFPVDSGRT